MAEDVSQEQLVDGLVEIFKAVLPATEIGPDSDFFALGGHSVLAGRVVAKARAHLGIAVSLRDVFVASTPRGIIEAVTIRPSLGR